MKLIAPVGLLNPTKVAVSVRVPPGFKATPGPACVLIYGGVGVGIGVGAGVGVGVDGITAATMTPR